LAFRCDALAHLIDLAAHPDDFRVLIEVFLEKLGLTRLEIRLFLAQVLDDRVLQDRRQVLGASHAPHLAVQRPLPEAVPARLAWRRAELGELLFERRPTLLDVRDSLALLDLLELLRAVLDSLALLVDRAAEPQARFGRGLVAELERLFDVEPREL